MRLVRTGEHQGAAACSRKAPSGLWQLLPVVSVFVSRVSLFSLPLSAQVGASCVFSLFNPAYLCGLQGIASFSVLPVGPERAGFVSVPEQAEGGRGAGWVGGWDHGSLGERGCEGQAGGFQQPPRLSSAEPPPA